MLPGAPLMRLLADWRLLTENEGQAILNDDWSTLALHQAQKAQLQDEITRALELERAASGAAEPAAAAEPRGCQPIVRELIALETRNQELLASRRHSRQPECQGLAQTFRNLQKMRRAYGPSHGPYWQSYS